jgi:hypothetical protein
VVSTNGRIEEVSLEEFVQGVFVEVQQQEVVEEEISHTIDFWGVVLSRARATGPLVFSH